MNTHLTRHQCPACAQALTQATQAFRDACQRLFPYETASGIRYPHQGDALTHIRAWIVLADVTANELSDLITDMTLDIEGSAASDVLKAARAERNLARARGMVRSVAQRIQPGLELKERYLNKLLKRPHMDPFVEALQIQQAMVDFTVALIAIADGCSCNGADQSSAENPDSPFGAA